MLEKLIIELGGIVPKDLLGAGQDTSKSDSKLTENSPSFSSPPVRHEEREQEMTATSTAQMQITPFAGAQDNSVSGFSKSSTSEMGVGGGNVLQGQMEEALMQKMEEVVQNAEDEVDLRNDDIIFEDPEADKIDDTDIETDDNGVYKVFKNINADEDDDAEDELEEAFKARTKGKQIQILLAAVKKQTCLVDENDVKINYVKKIYAEQQ